MAESLDLQTLARRYASGQTTPSRIVQQVRARIAARGDDGVWIALASEAQLATAAAVVEARQRQGESLPLFGVPFAVKDNIDAAGFATTAACPTFAYQPARSAAAVARLEAAGAIVVGKTNLDQFATGLVGVRSPYGVPRNPFAPDRIAGGSSSGSAVAVALGDVSFALGTDTAGSGRVPAAFNNVVGLKPSGGVISAEGVVPACRSLDCVSVFAATCDDAADIAEVMRGFDPRDPYAREGAVAVRFRPEVAAAPPRLGVPTAVTRARLGLGDEAAARAFDATVAAAVALGARPAEIDLEPFLAAGQLLYDGPFVAQRLEAGGALLASSPEAIIEPVRSILRGALKHDAAAAYAADAALRALRRQVAIVWKDVDALMLPTAPTHPRIDDVAAHPIAVNAALGVYATFVNLLELSALAVPSGFRSDGLPAGVTFMGPWGADARLAGFGDALHRATSTTIGATGWPLPPPRPRVAVAPTVLEVVVVGAHLSDQPLNHQLTSRGGTLVQACKTAPRYRLFALPGTVPPKPGLVRVAEGQGAAIEVEVWALGPAELGSFVAAIPPPLGIGKLELDDGRYVSGFIVEPLAVEGAEDISSFGGWRAYLRSRR